ncbi:MAG: aminoglycoside phosphotransferase family protein [Phycisphaeraceae bacterium]|nr:aminoglycoside phosphotransferase family protein [Phycisphaeraceae bacterium]MCW5753873.1 aminoglycoside phosphotransferase family protein [Phycisphaeraceae bacterium]
MPQHPTPATAGSMPSRHAGSPGSGGHDGFGLGAALGPQLRELCDGRLGEIEWFRSTWQRGGASTGFATWTRSDGMAIPVLVKIPVGAVEYSWTVRLGAVDADEWDLPTSRTLSTPRVIAAGETLGGHDIAWLVLERLDGPTLGAQLNQKALDDLLDAAVDFHARAERQQPVDRPAPTTDWAKAIHKSRELAPDCGLPDPQRWKDVLRKLEKGLAPIVSQWERRATSTWCHGDLHPGNAMYRVSPGGERTCVLIDLGLVHPGHWIEDGVYLERQYWGHSEMLCGVKPVSCLAKRRRDRGLYVCDDYPELANTRRVLMAACVPLQLGREGNIKYVRGALETLERLLPQVLR